MNVNKHHEESPQAEIQHLALAVDSHGWEDFPSHLAGVEAAEVLACWTAMWHPALLQIAARIPQWHRVDDLPEDPRGWIVLVPDFAKSQIAKSEAIRFSDRGGMLLPGQLDRLKVVANILEKVNATDTFDKRIVADFFSLGYCYLQVQLMTRQLRYSSSLDEVEFQTLVLQAVQDSSQADGTIYASTIQKCFDRLLEERIRFFPTPANLINLVYLTPETLGDRLQQQLQQTVPFSIHSDGKTLSSVLADDALADQLRAQIQSQKLCVVGGEFQELQNVLLSTWSCLRQFQLGQQEMVELTGESTRIFARRRFGLRVGLPGLLEQFGMQSAIHCTLDEGVFPQSSANQIRWEGVDGTTVNALISPPHLVSDPAAFLNLGVHVGEIIDINQDAHQLFVQWPGSGCDYWQDLMHSSRYGPMLGEFVTLATFFDAFVDPGFTQSYISDDYREPYLSQMVSGGARDPLSRFSNYWHEQIGLLAASGNMAMRVAQKEPAQPDQLLARLDAIDGHMAGDKDSQEISPSLSTNTETLSSAADAYRIVNPFSFRRRFFVPQGNLDNQHSAVLFTDESGTVLEVPGMGLAQITASQQTALEGQPVAPDLAEGFFLRNEFFEVEMDEATGGVGAIKQHGKRGNLLGQKIVARQIKATRSRTGRQEAVAARMVADECRVTCNSKVRGQITTRGALVIGKKKVATFIQKATIVRGIPLLNLEIELQDVIPPQGDPWQNYIACRFAWKDESSRFFTWQNESRQQLTRSRMVAPLALEIDQHEFRTTLLPDGRPWFQRIGMRSIDGLLVVPGETSRQFRFGVGVDLPYPYQAAISNMAADDLEAAGEPIQESLAWLFHLNQKNVMALYWLPAQDGSSLRVLLKETEGRRVDLSLRCFRQVSRAITKRLDGEEIRELTPQNDVIQLKVAAHELIEITLVW